MQDYYRLNTTILSDTYKYFNYMFRPLWPSSVWIQYQGKKIHNISWYSTNINVVSVGDEISFRKVWRACMLKMLYLVRSIRCHISFVTL